MVGWLIELIGSGLEDWGWGGVCKGERACGDILFCLLGMQSSFNIFWNLFVVLWFYQKGPWSLPGFCPNFYSRTVLKGHDTARQSLL